MARQSIPRFDLYGELGVEPSADEDTIEAAYRALIWRHDPDVTGIDEDARLVRLRVAHLWLTDTERRNRYDASRSRAAARADGSAPTTPRKPATRRTRKAAAVETVEADATGLTPEEAAAAEATAAAEARAMSNGAADVGAADVGAADVGAADVGATDAGATDVSWPVADLERAPRAVTAAPRPSRPSRRTLAGIGALALLVVVVGVAILLVASMSPTPPVAVATPTVPAPTPTAVPPTPSAAPSPTPAISQPPPTLAPVDFAAQQQSAWNTIQALTTAAAAGDVAAAQTMLGDTATGLRASGLKRATFPDVEPAEISVTQDGALFTAVAGEDHLTSSDGTTWTFDYADRPLAVYRSPSSEPVHDLWWSESDGKHHVYLKVAWVTIGRSGVEAKITWTFDPSRPDDATYFARATVLISSLALDSVEITFANQPIPMAGATTVTSAAVFSAAGSVPDNLAIGITVTNPRTVGGDDRAIESIFKLEVR